MQRYWNSIFLVTLMLIQINDLRANGHTTITTGADVAKAARQAFPTKTILIQRNQNDAILSIDSAIFDALHRLIHTKFHRCGGYFVHDNTQAAQAFLRRGHHHKTASQSARLYTINKQEILPSLLDQVDEEQLFEMMKNLSNFKNRLAKAQTGVESQKWLMKQWKSLLSNIPEATIEQIRHKGFQQPSIKVVIPGTTRADEVVILGGHGDSIAGWIPMPFIKAPGADDNASGIAAITEVLRIIAKNEWRPQRTLTFFAYAGEEIGLRGSKQIARRYRDANVTVKAVMQLDMTAFKGSPNYDIVLMTDHTNPSLTTFIGTLIDTYLAIPWTKDKCGYACSDHASWTQNGYPAVMPFESKMNDYNSKIHSGNDTIDALGHAIQTVHFTKLALAYLVEVADD